MRVYGSLCTSISVKEELLFKNEMKRNSSRRVIVDKYIAIYNEERGKDLSPKLDFLVKNLEVGGLSKSSGLDDFENPNVTVKGDVISQRNELSDEVVVSSPKLRYKKSAIPLVMILISGGFVPY